MRVLAHVRDAGLRRALVDATHRLSAELLEPADGRVSADVVVAEAGPKEELQEIHAQARAAGAALVVACREPEDCRIASLAGADEWVFVPVDPAELAIRLATASARAVGEALPHETGQAAELIRYQELLFDKLTGFPTLPVMIERARELLDRRGELTIVYIHFVWYEKIEEIFGWQKLDDVLETTAGALRDFYAAERLGAESLMMVSHIADDDFILFAQIPAAAEIAERRLNALSHRLESFLRGRIEEAHSEDIAALCGIYVGASTIFRNLKIRTERLIYRAIREAAQAARGAEQWERARKVTDLKATLREGLVFIEYFPIIVTGTEAIYGYEALARGTRRELRSPEVLFDVAEEANLIWELGRLLRVRAVQGILHELGPDQHLFLNVDPRDFDDPSFRNMSAQDLGIEDPSRIVLEITERTAIKDYPRFQEYLAAFRERGFRFAVDDAGSGYAGLGSIANLAPDYIKLDISLISNIDSNFLKQNLVETMVKFAEAQNALVIAEGVERREEFETIRQLGVHLAQGFLFHRPRYAGIPKEAA
ncbi:MAG: EAL domain-containing protein [Gemmatimonadetes bacterium]|nr:EAL domain-containing protein [Gemmatimonadota bacterium]